MSVQHKITSIINGGLTNAICASGANIEHILFLLKSKYVKKGQLRKAVNLQANLLKDIENAKNHLSKQITNSI
tara:strand:+ start:215 stop:433 length:219 start_codon:yes stop_codon:yes gene_type:complete